MGCLRIHWGIGGTRLHRALLAQVNPLGLELLTGLMATTARRTAGAKLDDECQQAETRRDPHEYQHLRTDVRPNVQAGIGIGEDIGKDDEHDRRHDRSDDSNQCGEERDDQEGECT